jgi:hypothetical protein
VSDVDYLIVGAGAMGMAFADVLFNESDSTFAMVDDKPAPGGHWNDAYPFVRLHQPSAFYGVNSVRLGSDRIDRSGWNAGLYELASKGELLGYYDQIMRGQFLASGRVHYFPNARYSDARQITSSVTGESIDINARKIVDARYMNVSVPATSAAPFDVAADVTCVPINDLPKEASVGSHYCIIGGGKTGMDACLWLLEQGVTQSSISWVRPRDSWILNRANIQPGELSGPSSESFVQQLALVGDSSTAVEAFEKLAEAEILLRLDANVKPTMYRCATITESEFKELKDIARVIRKGHVSSIDASGLQMELGSEAMPEGTVYINCTADGLAKRPILPVFKEDSITLQTVRFCQQVFSAALIARVELTSTDDAAKNEVCAVVPHPDTDVDYFRVNLGNLINSARWSADPDLAEWLAGARLDGFSEVGRSPLIAASQEEVMRMVEKFGRFASEPS